MFNKFTPIEFLYEVRKAYREAQEVKMRNGNNDMRLQRYRAHSISSVVEDLFARFLAENFSNEDLYFFVDIPLTYNQKQSPCYPDVLVCRKKESVYEIIYMFDVKTNTGWFRTSIADFANGHMLNVLENLKCATEITSKNNREQGAMQRFTINRQACYDMIILTDRNNTKKNIYSAVETVNSANNNIHIWVLSSSELNEKYAKNEEKIEIQKQSFEELYSLLSERAMR